jgi:hypothetical protein
MPFEAFELQGHDETGEFTNAYMSFVQMNSNFDDSFMKKKEKKEVEPKALEIFFDEGEFNGSDDIEQKDA